MRIHQFAAAALAGAAIGCSSPPKTATPATGATDVKPAAAAAAAPVPSPHLAEDKNKFVCKRGEEARSIRLETTAPKGCKLWYSSHGDKEPVAWSSTGQTHCESVSGKIRSNLESSGFECGDKKPATATVTPSTAAVRNAASAPKAAAAVPSTATPAAATATQTK